MTRLLHELSGKVKEVEGYWAPYAVIGGCILYISGYLALRFHLTALGIGTDMGLAILDERYLFAGAKFVVYLCATAPSLVLLVLLLGGIVYGGYRALPTGARTAFGNWLRNGVAWVMQPTPLLLGGVVFSVGVIQFLMRDCFELNNLLLRSDFPVSSRLGQWLLREDESRIALFFLGLVASCALSSLILLALGRKPLTDDLLVYSYYLLVFLVVLQILLLPINYGYLVQDKSLPKVSSLDGPTPLVPGMEAWLVWEGKEGMTYLLRNTQQKPTVKSLITLPRDQVKRVEIIAYDRIFPTLFASSAGSIP